MPNRVFHGMKECAMVVFFRLKRGKNTSTPELYKKMMDFSIKKAVVYRLITDFGTRSATDLLVTMPEDEYKWTRFLKENGMFLSRHDACNNTKDILAMMSKK